MIAFPDFAHANGLLGPFIPDGNIHRCATVDKPRKKNGSYRWRDAWGWVQSWSEHEKPVIWLAREGAQAEAEARRDMRELQRGVIDGQRQVATLATSLVPTFETGIHPYLARKGFPLHAGLIDAEGKHLSRPRDKNPEGPFLVIPMRNHINPRVVQSLQWIDVNGLKLFMRGGAAWGATFAIGARGNETWYCEGFATGLSLVAALAKMKRRGLVQVCFSASNMRHVAMAGNGPRFVIADNDAQQVNGRSGAGQTAAAETGLPWAMPDTVGDDANDVHQRDGIYALMDLMRRADV